MHAQLTKLIAIRDNLHNVPDDKYNQQWLNAGDGCGCALGHAVRAGIVERGGLPIDLHNYMGEDDFIYAFGSGMFPRNGESFFNRTRVQEIELLNTLIATYMEREGITPDVPADEEKVEAQRLLSAGIPAHTFELIPVHTAEPQPLPVRTSRAQALIDYITRR